MLVSIGLPVRLFFMEFTMPHHQREPTRTWLTGLTVTVTAMVSLFGFWRLSPGITFAIACLSLVVLLISAWHYGRSTRLLRERVKELSKPIDHHV